jgi:hypothetical protein
MISSFVQGNGIEEAMAGVTPSEQHRPSGFCKVGDVPRQAALTDWNGSRSDQKLTRNVN